MSGKTSLVKISFVIAILGVLSLVAVAPSVARAFFPQGAAGFATRIFGGQPEIGAPSPELQSAAPEAASAEAEPVAVVSESITAPDDSVVGIVESGSASAASAADTIELVGTLTAQETGVWTVNGISVFLAAATEIKGSPVVGDLVKVEGTLQEDGSVLAREIQPALFDDDDDNDQTAAGNEIEFVGTLTAQATGEWTVNGVSVFLAAATEIKGSPVVGDLVKVEGTLQEDGSVLAREIQPALLDDDVDDDIDDDDEHESQGNEVEFSGILNAKSETSWTVDGVTVIVTAMTELKGTLMIGSRVKVEGFLLADGTVEAHEIKSTDSDGDDDDRDDDDGDRDDDDDDDDRDDDDGGRGGDDDDDGGRDGDDDDDDDDDKSGHGFFIDLMKSLL